MQRTFPNPDLTPRIGLESNVPVKFTEGILSNGERVLEFQTQSDKSAFRGQLTFGRDGVLHAKLFEGPGQTANSKPTIELNSSNNRTGLGSNLRLTFQNAERLGVQGQIQPVTPESSATAPRLVVERVDGQLSVPVLAISILDPKSVF